MKNCLIVRLLNCLAIVSVAYVSGCATVEEKANEDADTVKVLMIGNSFSICVLNYLPKIAEECGEKLDLASLYIGGCTLQKHWKNAEVVTNETGELFRPYRYDRVVRGKRIIDGAKRNVLEVVAGTKWDVITVQQGSHESWKPESYHPYGDNLIAKIRELSPQAKILVQETWSYTPWDKRLKKWGIDQNQMYEKLHDAYAAFAKQHGLDVIPFGTSVQAWRSRLPVRYTENSLGGDVVGGGGQADRDHFKRNSRGEWEPNCDVFHLGRKGTYFQALVWARKLFGADLLNLDYKPEFVSDSDAKLMKEIAMEVK